MMAFQSSDNNSLLVVDINQSIKKEKYRKKNL